MFYNRQKYKLNDYESFTDLFFYKNVFFRERVRPNNIERAINLVIVGHVDAGKSTLVGHLLYLVLLL